MRQTEHGYDIMWGYHTPKKDRSNSNVDSSTYPLVKKHDMFSHKSGDGILGDILTGGVKLLPDLIKAIPGITGLFKKAPHDEKQRINNEILRRINESNDPDEIKQLYKLLKH
jgi:hypothetical protein